MATGWRVETRRAHKVWFDTFHPDEMPQQEFRDWVGSVLESGPDGKGVAITPGYFYVYEGALVKVFFYRFQHDPSEPGSVAVAAILPVLYP